LRACGARPSETPNGHAMDRGFKNERCLGKARCRDYGHSGDFPCARGAGQGLGAFWEKHNERVKGGLPGDMLRSPWCPAGERYSGKGIGGICPDGDAGLEFSAGGDSHDMP